MIKFIENNLQLRKVVARLAFLVCQNHALKKMLSNYVNKKRDVWGVNKYDAGMEALYAKYKVDFKALLNGKIHKLGLIATQEDYETNSSFKKACEVLNIEYHIFDPSDVAFIKRIKASDIETFIVRPSHNKNVTRQMFLEKIEVVANELKRAIYPSLNELKIYEAKRVLAYYLEANNIPSPKTWIFYDKRQAQIFANSCELPIVFKTHVGAGSYGVEILRTRKQVKDLVNTCFESSYLKKNIGDYRDVDYDYMIFQEYIRNVREYRIIKIGNSWMGHEKARNKTSEYMSGSGVNLWTPPSFDILEFCYTLALKNNFNTMCFDIFEDEIGNFYINELQAWFGSYNPAQMYIDGIPGRYVREDKRWRFEKGLFNDNKSMTLRLVAYANENFQRSTSFS